MTDLTERDAPTPADAEPGPGGATIAPPPAVSPTPGDDGPTPPHSHGGWMMAVVGLYLLTMFAVITVGPMFITMTPERWRWAENILFMMAGQVSVVVTFYFGSSVGGRSLVDTLRTRVAGVRRTD